MYKAFKNRIWNIKKLLTYFVHLNLCRKIENLIKTNQNYNRYFCKRWVLNYSRKNGRRSIFTGLSTSKVEKKWAGEIF